ncbi:tRNA preQ1(34) S-adenosylmethionine ribosyltransferase-isomerase QueA [Desulfovibrio sp.]|uniref:tRNA preQ1(34) S-adenosylmethionine ribosyltransferase-isomerase QueA n=1 Tax=Desulfovibrio sp. TaxID=885 RepID=UPI00262BE43F|nr:tRNA preQ1(34) S-adenosylmethionine ribosyltransferase-isomerase QueA [Desulfovibrio sp.]
MAPEPEDFFLQSYDFPLPEARIAQFPPEARGASRLMVLDRAGNAARHGQFGELARWLPEGALIVANNSRVLPARLGGRREATGGKVEFLLLTPLPLLLGQPGAEEGVPAGRRSAVAEGLVRSGGKLREGERLALDGDISLTLLTRGPFGRHRVLLEWSGDLGAAFARAGRMPLPPYIRRPVDSEDAERYQTIYARPDKTGSAAAPTAGLHFTPELRAELRARGFDWREVTLYVGYGTFSPVRCEDIRQHDIHSEYMEIPEATAKAVAAARAEGRPVVAVGTTSARALEGVAAQCGDVRPYAGWTNIFLYPGRPFRVVDALVTNFHLPGSSLLMLVSAFAGRKRMLAAYAEAIRRGYRFFSYGDAMLIR